MRGTKGIGPAFPVPAITIFSACFDVRSDELEQQELT
jgi:hypothetical protein